MEWGEGLKFDRTRFFVISWDIFEAVIYQNQSMVSITS